MSAPTKAIAAGVLILLVATSVPMIINASDGERTYRVELQEGVETSISERLNVTSENIRPPSPANATITVTDTETLESETKVIANGTSATYQLSPGNVTVTITAVETSPELFRADIDVPRTYGWSGPAQLFAGEIGVVFAVMGAVIVAGLIGSVIRQ